MVTMLDCVRRCAPLSDKIIDNIKDNTQSVIDYVGSDLNKITKIVLVGAGSSNTAATTSRGFIEKVTGIETQAILPNIFDQKTVYDLDALYIFTSQTGTSTLVKDMIRKINNLGGKTVAICEAKDRPVANEAKCFVDMGCGYEEYWYRTIGYVTSVVSQMAIGLRIGLENKHISQEEFDAYLTDAKKAIANHPAVVEKTLAWYEKHGEQFKDARSFLIYGSGTLYGVALEGALKVLETSKTYLGVGYEAEDGLHGPTLGFAKDDVLIALNDGKHDDWMSQGLIKFAKNELGKGYIFGENAIDDDDLSFEVKSDEFRAIEFAPTVEILAILLAGTAGVEVLDADHAKEHVSSQYFETHRG